MKNITRTLALIGYLALASIPLKAAAVVVIDFSTGLAGVGGTITESGGDVVGTDILIGAVTIDGTTSSDGVYTVTAGDLDFDTAANTITISGSIDGLGVGATTLLSGSFDSFSFIPDNPVPGTDTFVAQGPDVKSSDLLTAIGVDTSTPFEYFGFSIESANGTVISTDIINTAVPVPAAVWLFGSGLLGMVGIARRRRS